MIKQAYLRGLTKKAANTNFFNSYDDRWARTGIASLATLIGSKALGAGWGTAGTLAALAGGSAYNTHNYDAIKNRLTSWLGLGKKEQAPKPLDQNQKQQILQTLTHPNTSPEATRLLKEYHPGQQMKAWGQQLKSWKPGQ